MIYEQNDNHNEILCPVEKSTMYITDEILHVILVVFSPFGQKHRFQLAQDCIHRFENQKNVQLYVVELIYKDQNFLLQLQEKKRHLKLKFKENIYLWSKENLINIGVRTLLPKDWKYMAWVDADIEFENSNWDNHILYHMIQYNYDIVQLFSVCKFLDPFHKIMNYKNGIIANNGKGSMGYAWACTRSFYERVNGLFEYSIVGGADSIIVKCLYSKIDELLFDRLDEYNQLLTDYYSNFHNIKYGYIPQSILHYFHGYPVNRCYNTRYNILLRYNYQPLKHLIVEKNLGLLLFNKDEYPEFYQEIVNYFQNRKELN